MKRISASLPIVNRISRNDLIILFFSIICLIGGILSFCLLDSNLQIVLGFGLLGTSIISICYLKCKREKVNYIQV
jgi:hypothetical protein